MAFINHYIFVYIRYLFFYYYYFVCHFVSFTQYTIYIYLSILLLYIYIYIYIFQNLLLLVLIKLYKLEEYSTYKMGIICDRIYFKLPESTII